MPAYFDTGFTVRKPAWHRLATVLDDYPTDWADARRKAGIMWEPEITTAWQEVGGGAELGPDGFVAPDGRMFRPAPGSRLTRRSDTKLVLGAVSEQWAQIYHDERGMGALFDALVGAGAKFETAGSAREGRSVWGLAYLDEPYRLPGHDTEHLPFLAVLNDHTGSGACKAVMTQVTVVCWNTFQMASAEGDRHGRQYVFRHVGDPTERIEEAKAALAGLRSEAAEFQAFAQDLYDVRVDEAQEATFVSEFLPDPAEHGEVVSERVRANIDRARGAFRALYLDSPTTDGLRGTGYGLLQASTEYLDHKRQFRSQDSLLGRSILGPEKAKARAVAIIRAL